MPQSFQSEEGHKKYPNRTHLALLPNPKTLQLFLYQALVSNRLYCIQDNQNTVACPCSTDDLDVTNNLEINTKSSINFCQRNKLTRVIDI